MTSDVTVFVVVAYLSVCLFVKQKKNSEMKRKDLANRSYWPTDIKY